MNREPIGWLTVVAFLAVFLMGAFVQAAIDPSPQVPTPMLDTFYRWQTLVAGVIALGGAWATLRAVRNQINQNDRFERERRRREERAARVVLPLALSELTQYATDCIQLLEPFMGTTPVQIQPSFTAPRIPETVLQTLQQSARAAEPPITDQIQYAVGWLQVQHSRLEGVVRRIKATSNTPLRRLEAIQAMVDAAELHAACSDLFPYARGSTSQPQTSFESKLRSALFSAGILDIDNKDLAAIVKQRKPTVLTK